MSLSVNVDSIYGVKADISARAITVLDPDFDPLQELRTQRQLLSTLIDAHNRLAQSHEQLQQKYQALERDFRLYREEQLRWMARSR